MPAELGRFKVRVKATVESEFYVNTTNPNWRQYVEFAFTDAMGQQDIRVGKMKVSKVAQEKPPLYRKLMQRGAK